MSNIVETPKLTKKDFESDQDVRWCPGCGDYSILANVQKMMPELGVPRERVVWVSGIGCSSRFPYYMNTYGFHTIHGRAPAIAMGIKVANPELSVWLATGDGDGLSIGGNHLMHALRRNLDIKILLFNNRIYGLTKGQYSPTSEFGKTTKSTPTGAPDFPVDPASFAIGCSATFVARSIDTDAKHMNETLLRAAKHTGTSFVEIYQNCVVFNDAAFDSFTAKENKEEHQLRVEHGKPLVFGAQKNKGLRIDARTLGLEIATIGENGVTEKDILVHDVKREDPTIAFMMANLSLKPGFPTPIGVFRDVKRPTAEDLTWDMIDAAKSKKGDVDVTKLLAGNDTWQIK